MHRPVALSLVFAAALATGARAQGEPEQRATRSAPVNTVAVDYLYSHFLKDYDAWHLGAVSLGTRRPAGTFIARVNTARRYAENGVQLEGDAYPTIDAKTYAYLNAGHSGSTIFPEWRFGGEVFRSLPHAMEASLGMRYLGFPSEAVRLFTGSLGRYTGNYWFSVRPYVRDKPEGLAASASLTGRRYYADADNYVGARIGYGSTPGEAADLSQLSRTRSVSAGIQGSRGASSRTIATWLLNFEREERSTGGTVTRWEVGGGLKFRY